VGSLIDSSAFLTMIALITWTLLAVGALFCYELVRQNRRILRRLERAEARIETLAAYGAAGPRPFGERALRRSRISREQD
jgi:hypothetical protein